MNQKSLLDASKNLAHKKTKNHAIDISPICRDAPTATIALNFGVRGDIADVIALAKVFDKRFRGFGVLIPPILPFTIGIAGRPYNSVSTTLLCYTVIRKLSFGSRVVNIWNSLPDIILVECDSFNAFGNRLDK